jgi:hypothetical protein
MLARLQIHMKKSYLLVLAVITWLALPAAAQSCALCYTQASSASARMIEALRSGILILIIPPTLMTVGMFFVIHRKTYQFRNCDQGDAADNSHPPPDTSKI